MSVRGGWAVVAGVGLLGACSLTTDLDGFATRDARGPDAGTSPTDATAPAPLGDGSVIGVGDATTGADGSAPTYGDVVRADKPIAYWPLDEAPGANTAIETIARREGTVEGTVTFGVPGVSGTGVKVEENGAIDFGDILDLTGERAWTFEAWAFPSFTDRVFYELFNKRADLNQGIVLYVRKENASLTAQLEQNWTDGARGVSVDLPAPDHYIHVVFTYTPGTGVRGWADGKSGGLGYDQAGGPIDTTQRFRILGSFRGTVDELALYDHPLTNARIAAHYAAGKPR